MRKEEILARLEAGACQPETLVWCEGMSGWKSISDCFAQEMASAPGGASTDVQQMQAALAVAEEPLQQSVPVDGEPLLPQRVSAGANAAASPSAQVGTPIAPPPLPQGFLSTPTVFPQTAPPMHATVSASAIPSYQTTPPPLPQAFVQAMTASPAPPPLPGTPVVRMYYVIVAGRGQSGPYREDLLMKQVQTGACPPGSLIWTEGMPGWEPIENYFKIGVGMGVKGIVQGAVASVFKSDIYYPHTAIFACLRRYFKVSGRACRAEFWWFWLLYMTCYVGAKIADLIAIKEREAEEWALGLIMACFVLIIPVFTAFVRRMHDIGKPGIWCIVPLVNLFLAAFPSENRPNMYGERPAGPRE